VICEIQICPEFQPSLLPPAPFRTPAATEVLFEDLQSLAISGPFRRMPRRIVPRAIGASTLTCEFALWIHRWDEDQADGLTASNV